MRGAHESRKRWGLRTQLGVEAGTPDKVPLPVVIRGSVRPGARKDKFRGIGARETTGT